MSGGSDRQDLIQAALDGTMSSAQRAELDQLLATDPSVRSELERLGALSALLARLEAPSAPPDLLPAVMRAVRGERPAGFLRRLTNLVRPGVYVASDGNAPEKRSREAIMAARQNGFAKGMFVGAGALAVVALVAWFGGIFPPERTSDATGTVGAANRYRSEQIGAADVQVGTSDAQTFLQSETFDRIVRDPGMRKALSNESFRSALQQQSFREALTDQGFVQALQQQSFREALTDQGFVQALQQQSFREALTDQGFVQALQQQSFHDALTSVQD